MNYIINSLFFLLVFVVLNNKNISLRNFQTSDSTSKVVPINIDQGYKINNLTGDSIRPLINSTGDTIKTGVPFKIKSEFKHIGFASKPVLKKALIPKPVKSEFLRTLLTKPPVKTRYKKSSSNNFASDKKSALLVLVNSIGDTVKTGIPIPVIGKSYSYVKAKSAQLQFPNRKELSSVDIRFIDVEQGLSSSCIVALVQDRRGDIWIGTEGGGVCVYDGTSLTQINPENGLNGKKVRDILEDTKGNLWFATDQGMSKFDGKTFTQYTEKEGLTHNHVLCLAEDKTGNIWCGTNGGGVTRFDGKTFTHYSEKEGVSNIIRDIAEDRDGNLWFSSYTEGIFKFDGNSFESITTKEGLSNNSVNQIYEDKAGNLWIATWGGGLCKFDGTYFTCYTENEGLINNNVNVIAEDKQGNLWIGTWEGISKFDGESFTNYTEEQGLSDNDVFDLMFDQQENLWLGTWSGGVNIFNSSGLIHFTEKQGLNNAFVISILEDKNNQIWLGNWDGVNQLNENGFVGYTNKNALKDKFGCALSEDAEGNIWIGGEYGSLTKFDGKSFVCYTDNNLINNTVHSILCDRKGVLWLGMQRSGLCKFDGKQYEYFEDGFGLNNKAINSIAEDRNGNIWMAIEDFGVAKYKGETFTFYTEKEGLSSNSVISIFEDTNGILWFGTDGAGLNRFNGTEFSYITTEQGLSSNNIRSIIQDKNQNIWVGTNHGLNVLINTSTIDSYGDAEEKQSQLNKQPNNPYLILQYNFNDGLKDIEFNKNSILCDNSNRLWFGTRKNLSMIDLGNRKFEWSPIKVSLEQIDINEQFVDFLNLNDELKNSIQYDSLSAFKNCPKNLHLAPHKNHLTFHFSSNEYRSPRHVKYSYKIEGLNANWSKPSVLAHASYQNLPKGNHILKVKAIGQNQIWSEVLEYSFSIAPRWWNTNLAIICYFLFSILLIYFLIKWRTLALNRRKNELVVIVDELQKAKIKAEESEKLKSAFLLNLSHEIRTPMNGILGFTNLLNQKDLTGEEHQKYIDFINVSGKRLLNTVTNLIQISRIETGLVDVVLEKVDLLKKASEICSEFKEEAEKKSIQFIYNDLLNDNGFEVETDIGKFELVLKHLINNAIKYTSKGRVKVGYAIEKTESGIQLQFYVEDSGDGIPKDRLNAIFNRFEQADIEDKDAKQGTGIGLSIALAFVEMLNGKMRVESEVGKGSIFFFTLPFNSINYNHKQNQSQEILSPFSNQNQKFKVLIAEDEKVSAMHLSILLKQFSMEILYAKDGVEAVQVFDNNPDLDLILMDIKMPVLSGIEAIKQIREKDQKLIIIGQSAHALSGDKQKAMDAGCNEYITKPIIKQQLIQLLQKHLKIESY